MSEKNIRETYIVTFDLTNKKDESVIVIAKQDHSNIGYYKPIKTFTGEQAEQIFNNVISIIDPSENVNTEEEKEENPIYWRYDSDEEMWKVEYEGKKYYFSKIDVSYFENEHDKLSGADLFRAIVKNYESGQAYRESEEKIISWGYSEIGFTVITNKRNYTFSCADIYKIFDNTASENISYEEVFRRLIKLVSEEEEYRRLPIDNHWTT